MPFFRYLARDRSGKLIDEVLEATNEEDLVNNLQAKGLIIISVNPAADVRKKEG